MNQQHPDPKDFHFANRRMNRRIGRQSRKSFEVLEPRTLMAVITPFTPRYSTNANGDILFVSNTLMTAPASDADAVRGQNGVGTKLNNNDFNMVYVDVDSVASTFNSSRATLTLPTGGNVLFAGLYWGGHTSASNRNTVKFSTPTSGGYLDLSGAVLGADSTTNYQAFINVTTLVRNAGVGTYGVANVQATTGSDRQAGWALVVVYSDPAAPPRNLVVFDGLAVVNSTSQNVTIPISGFVAPPTGPVNANIGVVSYEGDLGYTGDSLRFNGTVLSNATNESNNFFNSSVTNRGTRVDTKSPNYLNQFGFDADIINTSGLIANGATSATIGLTTSNDVYLPGVVTTAIELYAPVATAVKSVVDLNGGPVEPGDILEYTINVGISSGEAATQTVLLDPIPANASYLANSLQIVSGANSGTKSDTAGNDQAEYDAVNNRVVFRLGTGATGTAGGTINVGQSSVVTFRVRVSPTAPDGTVILNQASMSFVGQNTGAGLVASSTASGVVVSRRSDLGVTHTVSNTTPNVGDLVTLTVGLTNLGPFDNTNVRVDALLPPGLEYVSGGPNLGSYSSSTGIWDVGTVVVGASPTLTIQARVTGSTAITSKASVRSADLPDPVASNNGASATLVPRRADLELIKGVSNPRPNVGDQITFTTVVTNRGPDAASNITISDLVPAGFTLLSNAPSQGSYDAQSGVWTLQNLASGSVATLTLTVNVDSANASVALASVVNVDQFDPISGNNSSTAPVTPQQADLSVNTAVNNPAPLPNEIITYTVTLNNSGPDAATNVVAASTGLPLGAQILSVSLSQGTFDQATTRWAAGTVAVGTSPQLVIRARVTGASITPVTVNVGADQFDPYTANNSSRTPVSPQEVSLAVSNTVSNPTPNRDELITFTVGVRNGGPATATSVVVTDALPAGLTFVSSAPGRGSYDPATGIWTVGSVNAGELVTLNLVARVAQPAPQTSTATITSFDQFEDGNDADNTSSITVIPKQSDLLLSFDLDNLTPNVGEVITATVTLNNLGPDTATGVRVTGALPPGITLVSATPTQGSFDPTTGIWTVGTVDVLTPRQLIVKLRVDSADAMSGVGLVEQLDQFDPNPDNNLQSATIIPKQANLALTQAVDNPTPNVGDVVAFTLTLTNNGPDSASGVRILESLPAGLTFVSASPDQGVYDPNTGIWDVGSIGSLAQHTLVLRATVNSDGSSSVTANIGRADQYDPNTGDNTASAAINPQRASLSVAQTISTASPNVGDVVTFTVTLNNAGPDTATGVVLEDILPPGLEFVGASTSQGSYDPVTGLWTVGAVASAGSTTLLLNARVLTTVPFTNGASIVAANQFDPNTGDNTATASGTPLRVDVAVSRIVDNPRPNVGDVVTFTVRATNLGPDLATNVQISSPVSTTGFTVVSFETSQGTYDPATGAWSVGNLATSDSQVLTIRAQVISPTPSIARSSLARVDQFDTGESNNVSTVALTPQQADLGLTTTVDDTTPNVGQFVTYTVTLTNTGPDRATGVIVADTLPSNVQFVSATPSLGGFDPTTGFWTIGTVDPGTPLTLQIVGRVLAPGTSVNTASIQASDQFDPLTANNTASAASDPQQADLALASTVDLLRPNVGDVVTFTVTLTNAGPGPASNVTVNDLLPAGYQFDSATTSQGLYDNTNGIWTVGPVVPGTPQTLQIRAVVTGTTSATATASIATSDQFDPNPGNNSTTATTTTQRSDLTLTQAVDKNRPNVGDVVTFTLTLSTAGPDAATGVVVNDLLPAGLTYVDASGPGSYDPATGLWQVGTVVPGAPVVLQIQARVDSPQPVANTATASATQFDPILLSNSATVSLNPQQADLIVGMSVDNPTPNVGNTVAYTIQVTNVGPDHATGVRILDLLPAGLGLDSALPSQGLYSQSTGIWEVGQVNAGSVATLVLILKATVLGPDPVTNTASILAADQADPNAGNNSASVLLTPQQADLQLAKSVDNPAPNVGEVITFLTTINNAGPNAATGVRINDALPAGFTFVSATTSAGTYDASSGIWILGQVPAAGTATLAIQARVNTAAGSTGTAAIAGVDQFDPSPANNTASVAILPQQADLALTGVVDIARPNVGDVVTFTLNLTNNGPNPATAIRVQDALPAGYTLINAPASSGSYDTATGLWTLPALESGASATLTLQASLDVVDPAPFKASVVRADQFDLDPGNNQTMASVSPQRVDLALAMSVSNPTPNLNEAITYTIVLSNQGPDAASNVSVIDLLPPGVTLTSSAPEQGSFDSGTGIWTVATLNPGQSLTLTLNVQVTDPAAIINRVQVQDVDQFDTQLGNNAAETSTVPQQAELTLAQGVDNPRPDVNGTVVFTIRLRNLGPNDATNVVVSDPLPAGLSYVSNTASFGSYDSTTGLWTLTLLPGQQEAVLTLTAVVESPATLINEAAIQGADQFDPNLNNNTSSAQVQPLQNDLSLTHAVDVANPNVGDTVRFVVTLSNNGPDDATGVQVRDLLPLGLDFDASQPEQGTYDPTTGIWQVGDLAAGTTTTLVITAKVASPGPASATAELVATNHFDPNPADNSASVQLIAQSAELALTMTVDKPQPNVDEVVTFTVTLVNAGPDAATNVSIQDLLPAGFVLESAQPSRGTYDASAGIWAMEIAGVGTVGVLVLRARVTAPGPLTNTATITAVDQFDGDSTNNTASVTVVPRQADLALAYAVDNLRPNFGDTVNLTVTVTNRGPDSSTAVVLLDQLIPGLTILSADPGQGAFNPNNGLWVIGSIPAGESRTLTLEARVDSGDALTSVVQITAADEYDSDPTNNAAAITITPQRADLVVTNVIDDARPDVGSLVNFTITVTDVGPDPATGVRLNNLLPAGFTFVSANPSRGSYNGDTGVWDLGQVDPGSPQTLRLVALVTSFGATSGTATITTADQFDPSLANNSAQVAVAPMYADLSLTLSADVVRPNVNQLVTFTLTLNSDGPDVATGVQVAIPLPPGFQWVAATPSQGNYDPATGIWTAGAVSPNTPLTLQIQAIATGAADTLVTARILTSDRFDATTGDWTTAVALLPHRADLGLAYAVDNARPDVGDIVTFILSLNNSGLDDASNIRISSPLPDGFQLISATPGPGVYDAATGLWTVPTLGFGGTTTLVLQARVTSPAATSAVATLLGADQFDSNPANNTAAVQVSPLRADLAVALDTPAAAVVGQVVPIRVGLTNLGPDASSGVVVRVALPAGLRPSAFTPSQGVYDPATGIWTVGNLPAGAAPELIIQAEVVAAGSLATTALVTQSGRLDPTPGNNTAARVIAARPAPPAANGQLGGVAFSDLNGDGVRGPNEPGVSGVTIRLNGVDRLGNVVSRETTTLTDGSFRFEGLLPGLFELAHAGPGGVRIPGIDLPEGGAFLGFQLAIPAVPGSRLAGTVYYDLNHNGVFDGPDFGIGNTTVLLSGLNDLGVSVQRQVFTAADGSYVFDGLRPGTYTLTEIQPKGFHDYRDHLGTLGGTARNDRFEGIVLGPQASGENYNFGELQGRNSQLRHFIIYLNNAEARLRARRALNPDRFDANHPQLAQVLTQGRIPVGQGYIARSRANLQNQPAAGARRVLLQQLRRAAATRRGGSQGPAD